MLVLLKQNVQGTGKAGDVVKVSDGYARNMLIPRGLAVEATEGNIRAAEKQKERQIQKAAEDKENALAQADALANKEIKIAAKAGDGGRLFGAITSKDISEAAKEQLKLDIEKKKIELEAPIKNVGTYTAVLKLYQEVKAEIKVTVVPQEEG